MKYKHISKKTFSHYSFSACRKPEIKFDTLCHTLKSVAQQRKDYKAALNTHKKALATETRYVKVLEHINCIQHCHSQLLKYYEMMVWLRYEYVAL